MNKAYEHQILHCDYHIHGDNIVECERALHLILQALEHKNPSISTPFGSPTCPEYRVSISSQTDPVKLTLYPGFRRWDKDIHKAIRERGGILREVVDVIITSVTAGQEKPLIAIEFCGALPAGNQAWQRSGRAYSFGKSKIPYLYVAELGGYELGTSRDKKSPRLPNPAVPFSYLSYSAGQDTTVYPIFTTSPSSDEELRTLYANVFAERELVDIVRSILFNEELDETLKRLQQKVLSFVKIRANTTTTTLSSEQWEEAYSTVLSGASIVNYLALQSTSLDWSKTTYIDTLTDSARALIDLSNELAIGLTSTNLPMCIIKKEVRKSFATSVTQLYDNLPDEFIEWLNRNVNLVICWITGFKPRGDDSRPDRGLPPFARMLIGEEQDLLSVVYGPAKEETWPTLVNDPNLLINKNGLWQSILAVSDAILIDSSTDHQTQHGYVRNHWESAIPKPHVKPFFVSPRPVKIGEHDIDTVLHTIMAKLAGADVFECMCNPPGGDWSGMSFLVSDRNTELRWVSLPRVSGENTKRPDHVFQLFNLLPKPIILCIESKERPNSVETKIGLQIVSYVIELLNSPASIERKPPDGNWSHSKKQLNMGTGRKQLAGNWGHLYRQTNHSDFVLASAVAFMSNNLNEILDVRQRSEADLLLCLEFKNDGGHCSILLLPTSKVGRVIAKFICGLNLVTNHIHAKLSS